MLFFQAIITLAVAVLAAAETHTIHFDNACGRGTVSALLAVGFTRASR